MNKETQNILDYINKSGHYLDKLHSLRRKFSNIKDFQNQVGYLVMEIVNEEKKFINISRKTIDLPKIVEYYF